MLAQTGYRWKENGKKYGKARSNIRQNWRRCCCFAMNTLTLLAVMTFYIICRRNESGKQTYECKVCV